MKKKVLSIIGVAAFAMAVAFNINAGISNDIENDVALANVEALAMGEVNPWCPRGCVDGHALCWCNGWHDLKELQVGSNHAS